MVNRKLTRAGYGLNSWLQQRITAIIMLVLVAVFLIFIGLMAIKVDSTIGSWQALFQCAVFKIAIQLFFSAMFIHAWVGVRDLWMDYIQSTAVKLILYVLTIIWLLIGLIYSIKIIWV